MKKMLIVSICLIFLGACTGESNGTTAAQVDAEQTTGNKFKDAAIKKVQTYNAGLSRENALCVVEELTANGVYGLGEINQLKLEPSQVNDNNEKLYQAYLDAIANCSQ